MSMITIAGLEVVRGMQARRAQLANRGDDLVRLQVTEGSRGILGVELVKSIYGWSVRYTSGLQNWGLIAAVRMRNVDGSVQSAVDFAVRWAAQDPTRRYVQAPSEVMVDGG